MKILLTLTLAAIPLAAQEQRSGGAVTGAPIAAAAVPDKVTAEIARQERDLLLADAVMRASAESYNAAQAETERLKKTLAEKMAEASKACAGRQFDGVTLRCVDTPKKP